MAQVSIRINGYTYTVGCEDGQEDHLLALAEGVDQRTQELKRQMGPQSESRALMYAALMLADEVHDLKAELDEARGGKPAPAVQGAAAETFAQTLLELAERIETVADTLERP